MGKYWENAGNEWEKIGINPDAIERQLAHVEENKIRAAYNRAEYLAERTEMMQWYSDYLRERYEAAQIG